MDNLVNWKNIELSCYLDILTGYAFSSKNFNDEVGIPLIRIRDLLTHNPVTYYNGSYDEKYIVNKGDILVGMDGEFNIVKWRGPKALLNQRVAKLESKDDSTIDNKFIYYRLGKELKKIEALTPSTTVKHLSKKDIHSLDLSTPPLNEQQKIAEILSTADEQIENTEQLIQKTKELKKGLMQQLLTKGIGHSKFKVTELGEIPVEWEIKKIGELANNRNEKFNPLQEKNEKYIALEHIEQKTGRLLGFEDSQKSTSMKTIFKKGDILFGKLRPYLRKYWLAQFDGVCATEILAINSTGVLREYLYFQLQTDKVIEYLVQNSFGTKMPRTSWKEISEFCIPVPPLEEQFKIAEVLSALDEQVEVYEQEKAKQIELKKGLMQQLLTGKVRVTV